MLALLRRSLFTSFPPIKFELPSFTTSNTSNNQPANAAVDDHLRDLDFDIYEFDLDEKQDHYSNNKPNSHRPSLLNYAAFDSYDWAFSFRESSKTDEKLVLEVSLERIPKEPSYYETHCLPDPSNDMTLLRNGMTETAEMISEEEQNMIMAAIIASQNDEMDIQIPKHIREEMEHAQLVVAMEESARLDRESQERASAAARARPPTTPPAGLHRAATFAASTPSTRDFNTPSSNFSSPRSLTRTNSDIPWTNRQGERVEGESAEQQRFRELLQFHAVAAASIANASARTGVSNISGNSDSEYDWIGQA